MSLTLDEDDYALLGWGDIHNNGVDTFFNQYQGHKERCRIIALLKFYKNKDDPAYKKKEAERQKALYKKQMRDPMLKQREVERSKAKYLKRKQKLNELNRTSAA